MQPAVAVADGVGGCVLGVLRGAICVDVVMAAESGGSLAGPMW